MKKLVSVVICAGLFVACTQNKDQTPERSIALVQDTSNLYNNSVLTDMAKVQPLSAANVGTSVQYIKYEPVTKQPAAVSHQSSSNRDEGDNNASTGSTTPAKKGWSHAARGAVVGAGTGAITGAIVNKEHRGQGTIIGAVIGAASGYIIGNEVDKKKKKQKKQ